MDHKQYIIDVIYRLAWTIFAVTRVIDADTYLVSGAPMDWSFDSLLLDRDFLS